MDRASLFENIVAPSIERLGLFEIVHDGQYDGRDFRVTHRISKHVFTEFDAKLSKYLAAVQGMGLPGASVETKIHDPRKDRTWSPYPVRQVLAVPDALLAGTRLALGDRETVDARIGGWVNKDARPHREVELTDETAGMLERSLKLCLEMGSTEFLEISCDHERVLARPAGSEMGMMVIDITRGVVTVPEVGRSATGHWQGPLYGFEESMRTVNVVTDYIAQARHEVAHAKEDAILNFREAAEKRIMQFDDALGDKGLTGFRLKAAEALVSRLQVGLGDTLLGLSEAAQITALDWADQVSDAAEEAGVSTALMPRTNGRDHHRAAV